ncbi:hypothetical protein BCR32DRAFT_244563 [Anaeromyces robustus]|uniref:Calponin-homology (CH) domain-containing protein n=1 Tax=Anaeromyces robustus TaxID=1754192 RepID=A0A1Y1X865_9FUNG|nr:hypothetical protein BCR32DRAFT_244563 [Anaeromyces robustus]|eukprot:ORX81940.1 hypothetical protein BCR32DRAFT_244563 [Anaeromyces robustus]
MNFFSKKLNDFTRNSTFLKRSNGVKRLSNISKKSNSSHQNSPEELTEEQKNAKNSWNTEDPVTIKQESPSSPSSPSKNSWRRSTIRQSKTLNRRLSSYNNGQLNIRTDMNHKPDLLSPLRKSASVASPLSSQNPKMLLLNWCKNILKLYVELEITNPINDFSKSWQNGVAFLSLIHSIRNDIVPEIDTIVQEKIENGNIVNILPTPKRTASLANSSSQSTFKLYTAEPKDWYNNLERAFSLAEKHFKIISLLDPNDIISVKNPDERIIMTYISEFYWYIQKEKKLAKENKLPSPPPSDIGSENDSISDTLEVMPKNRKRANTSTSMTMNSNINNINDHILRSTKSQSQLVLNKKHSNLSFKSINSIFSKSSSNKNSPESNGKSNKSFSFDYFKSNDNLNQYHNTNNKIDTHSKNSDYINGDNLVDNYSIHSFDSKSNHDIYKSINNLNNKDDLRKRLDEEIKNYLNIADKFSLWIKETQQIQYQILWFLFSMTNVNETLDHLSPPKSTISPIYTPIFDINSSVEDLESTVKMCVNQLENELNNLDVGDSDGARIKQQFNKAFEQITKTASIIDKEMKESNMNENQSMISKRNEISSIATIYSTHSSILQHLEQLIKYTFPQTKKILQNYVRWNKEWDEVLNCVNEDLVIDKESSKEENNEIADISISESIYTNRSGAIALPTNNNNVTHTYPNAKSLKQEVDDWIQKIDDINEKVSELMLKREQAMKVRKNTLQAYSNKFNLHKQNVTKNRWTLLYNITKDQVKKSIFKGLYDVDIDILNKDNKSSEEINNMNFDKIDSEDIYNTSKVFVELENELSSYSQCLNSEYPAKLNNLYQRVESLLIFLDAEFKNRAQLNTRRIFPNLPLGGVTRLTKLPTLTSIPPPNLQFSYFPKFMIKNADEVIAHGRNEVLQPLINDGIDRVDNLGTIIRDLLQNITNRRKESDKLQDILLKEEQKEAENLHYIQNKILDYYRMIKRLEIWIDNTKQDLSIFKEQIPDINVRLKDKSLTGDIEYIETDRTVLENTKKWCSNITYTIEEMMKENYLEIPKKFGNQNLNKSNFDKLWREIKYDIVNYENTNSEIEDSADESSSSISVVDDSMEKYIPKHAIHDILFNSLKEFNLSIYKFVNNTIIPTQETLNNLIDKKVTLLKENWIKEGTNIKQFLENSKKNQFNTESFEEIEEKIKNQLKSIFDNWNSKIKNLENIGDEVVFRNKERAELTKYNVKEIKNIQEVFNQQLNSAFQNLSQIISMRTENEVPTFNQQLLNFEKEEWDHYIDICLSLKKFLKLLPQQTDITIKDIDKNIDELTTLKDEVMEMNTSFIQKQTTETPVVMKRLISYNNKANSILDISKGYNDKIAIISQLVESLTSENNVNNELEKIYTSIYAAIKKMISDNSELELSEIENISLMRPAIFNIQQQLKEVIYANITQLDEGTIAKRNSIKRASQIYNISSVNDLIDIENNDICRSINDFSKEYVKYNQELIDYYSTICHSQYLNIQQLLTETTEWYNIYHQLFEWIAAADRLRVDNEERIKKYSSGGTYEVPFGFEPKLDKKRIEEIEQDQSRLENRHKEFKNGSRYRRVINSKKNILDSMNKISTSNNVLSKNKRLLDAVMNINERHTSLMFTKENRKAYENENYALLPEIIEKFVEFRLHKFSRVEQKLMEIIQIRSTDIIICKKIFNEINIPNKALLKDIATMNDDLDNILVIQKQNMENIDSYETIMRNINSKASSIVNHTLELIQNIRSISESTVAKEYELLEKELVSLYSTSSISSDKEVVTTSNSYDGTNISEYKENRMKFIKKALSKMASSMMEKNKSLNEHYEKVLDELTKNIVRNWEEKNGIIGLEHWIINLKGNLNKYIELYENIPSNSLEQIQKDHLNGYIQGAINLFETYQGEIKTHQPKIENAKINTEKTVKSLRSLISSSSNSVISQVSNTLYESMQTSPTPMMASPFESLLNANIEIIKRRSMDNMTASINNKGRPNTGLYSRPEEIMNRFKNIDSFLNKIITVINQELSFAYQSRNILGQYNNAEALLSNLNQRIQKFVNVPVNENNPSAMEKDKSKDGIISQFENELHEVEKININKNLSEIIDNLIGSQSEKSTVMEETIISALNKSINILKDYAKNLQEQIVSLKRSKILFEGYIKQSHEVRNWIIDNHDILEKFNKSIDEQTIRCDEVKQKFLAENIEDIPEEEIRIAYQTEEAIINDIIENLNNEEIAIKRYEITYEHLKTYSDKILSDNKISKGVLSDNSLKIIKEYQEKVTYLWNDLNSKLEILKNRLEIRIKVLLWIKKMEESETIMWSLEENIEKAEELNVEVDIEDNPAIQFGKAVDEIIREWEYQVSFREETHEKLKSELNEIEVRAEAIKCENELDVFNKNWYLINISESLASLQELFEYKKQRLFETSQQLEQWIIQLNGLEEWITVTNTTLKENLESDDFGIIVSDNDMTNQTNVKTWSHNQISLSLQISNEISNKLKTLNIIKDELVRSFNEVVPPVTCESYVTWINGCHEKLNTLYEEIQQMKIVTDKLLERASQYQQWQSRLLTITSDVDDISEMINYEEIDDNMYIALYDRLNNLEKILNKVVNEQSVVVVDISNNETEITNAKNLTKRTDEIQRRIDENRKAIQDSQENIMKIKVVNTINQELERIDLWCTSTMRDLPKASLLMESMNSAQNSSIENIETLPVINIEALSKTSEEDLTNNNISKEGITTTETSLRDAIKLHNFVELELRQNRKDMGNLRQTYEDTFRNVPSLDNQYLVLEKRLESVEETLLSGINRIDVIKRVFAHDKATFEIFAWINTANKKLQSIISTEDKNKDNNEKILTKAIHELENRMEIFHASIKDYNIMTEKVQNVIKGSSINSKEKNNYLRLVNERSKAILSEWDIINELLIAIKNDKTQKEREMKYNIVLNEINHLITGIKERIFNVGQLNTMNSNNNGNNNKYDKNEDQLNIVFGRLEGELIAGVYPKLSLFEKELNSLNPDSNEYKVFYKKLSNLHSQADILIEIINERKIKLRILKYVQNHNKITDKIEQQINEFNKVIDNQNSNMSRSDIETALAVLDSKAMYFNASISKMLEEAKEQIENIKDKKSKDDWKVLERQHQIEKKWEVIKNKVKRRKDLLSAKLIAKTEGQSNSGIPRSNNRNRTNSTSSNSSYRLSVLRASSTTPSNNRSGTPPRSRSRSITPGNNNKKRTRKPSLFSNQTSSPSMSPTPPPVPANLPSGPIRVFIPVNDYIPDPKDKLDVEVAHIVNKCPRSIKVTKAEGEGKYWFGEVIPKLCYCRYLRSGLIMVRVGGGWQELSKFLLEHSNLEHRIPLVRSFAPEDASIAENEGEGQVIELDRNEAANTSYSVLQKLAASKTNKK